MLCGNPRPSLYSSAISYLRLRPSLGGSFFQPKDAVFVILLAIQFTPHIDFPQCFLRPCFACFGGPAVVLAGLFQILRHTLPVVV